MPEDRPQQQTLWTPREIAERERLSIDSVKRALRNKRLEGHKVGTRGDWRIPHAHYLRWVAEGLPIQPAKPPSPTTKPTEPKE